MVDLRALGTEERKRRKGSVCAKRRTKLVGCATCTLMLDLGGLVDSGARKGVLLCVLWARRGCFPSVRRKFPRLCKPWGSTCGRVFCKIREGSTA